MNTTIIKKTIITHREKHTNTHTQTHTSKHCTEVLQQSKQEVG